MTTFYWVPVAGSGTGTADNADASHWSLFSGGAGGAGVPGAGEDVVFDANSFTGAGQIVTAGFAFSCRSMDWTGVTNNPTFDLTNNSITIHGNIKLVAGMSFSGTRGLNFGTNTGISPVSIDFGGKTIDRSLTFDDGGTGQTYNITSAFTETVGTVTLNQGTLVTGAFTHNWNRFASSNVNARALNLTGTTINITATSGTLWDIGNFTGITLTSTGSTINFLNGSTTVALGDLTYNTLNWTGATAGVVTLSGNFTAVNLSMVPANANSNNCSLAGNITVTTSLNLAGVSIQNRGAFSSSVPGVQRTITYQGVSGSCTVSNWDFLGIIAVGITWPADSGNIGNRGNNTGVTARTAANRYAVMGAANQSWTSTIWANSSGGATNANNFPLPQDTVIIDTASLSGTRTLTINYPTLPALDCSLAPSTFTLASSTAFSVYGSVTLSSAMGCTVSTAMTLAGRGVCTLTNNGKTLNSVTVNAGIGTLTLQDALNSPSGTFSVVSGTFNSNAKAITCAAVNIAGSTTRTVNLTNSTVTVNGNISTMFQMGGGGGSTNLTLITTGTQWIFQTAGVANYTLNLGGLAVDFGASMDVTGSGSGSFGFAFGNAVVTSLSIKRTKSALFQISGTNSATVTNLTVFNAPTAITTIQSSTAGTQALLIKAGGGIAVLPYVKFKDIAASPANTWATGGTSSLDLGNNSGIVFSRRRLTSVARSTVARSSITRSPISGRALV